MSLVALLIVLAVVGVLLYLVNQYIPMQPPIKQIINVIVIFAVVLWLLQGFGLLDPVMRVRFR